ncbi:Wzz/FepE/Etk N-terminal domain-containing protein [Flavobacterium hydrophilum]|uniref:Lipopolysaccharide biosynthesis protein n=1 Tax=Flavobacterium hydrophilum TaxID=2211445 RepID=A0A2V4BZL6_9FLAO|nr:Wzz/FepE/Etk N-terminal domain-containing protein [Flavobacterium hydrophilum]PXY44052.1 lipopolysaccharide biosynthesis protein [Flavobacterium hydrophilum]
MEQQQQNNEISLYEILKNVRDWYAYLLLQWKKIIIIGFIGALLGVGYSILKKPIYTARLTFALEDGKSSGGLGGALGLASTFGIDVGSSGGNIFVGANLNELFKSRLMVERTLLQPVLQDGKTISLAERFIQINKWRKNWEKKSNLAKLTFDPLADRKKFTRTQDSILGEIYKSLVEGSLTVGQKEKKIDIITMEVKSKDELFAKDFCLTLAKEVSEFYVNTKTKKSQENLKILTKQTDSIRGELNAAITGVAIANDNTFNLNPALNVRRTPSARRQVDVQANTAILTELIKQSELAKVTLRKETPLIQGIDKPILPLENNKIRKSTGFLGGGFLFGFLAIIFLSIKKIYF